MCAHSYYTAPQEPMNGALILPLQWLASRGGQGAGGPAHCVMEKFTGPEGAPKIRFLAGTALSSDTPTHYSPQTRAVLQDLPTHASGATGAGLASFFLLPSYYSWPQFTHWHTRVKIQLPTGNFGAMGYCPETCLSKPRKAVQIALSYA